MHELHLNATNYQIFMPMSQTFRPFWQICTFLQFTFDTANSWDHCLFLYFTTQLKDRFKQTFKYDQMPLTPSHSIRQYYWQNIARMFIFPVNLTRHGFFCGGGPKRKRQHGRPGFRCQDIKTDFTEISWGNINCNSSGLGWGQTACPCWHGWQ